MPRKLTAGTRARRTQPEAQRPSALRLWLRRRKPMMRPAAKVTILLALFGIAASAVASLDPASKLGAMLDGATADIGARVGGLVVTEVRIEGARNAPPAQLRRAIGVKAGDPVLGFAPEAARERLQAIPWIEEAEVQRHLSGLIHIKVKERAPFAIWQNNGRFAIIDREGRTVATDRLDAFGPLPLIVGAGAEKTAATLYDLLRDAPDVLARTQALVRIGERRWNLRLHSGTDVLLPEAHEAAAVQRLAELQRQNQLLDRPLHTVDLRLPDRLVLRPIAQQEPEAAPTATRARARSGRNG
ncbi:cell division protein FtsQ/DivIB [Roseomonas xinghualingensis]|uniref:cell division protein FtsQ/DivIB n=1 Tax=Roseomonas xinghualingensis TaxID=2986475 RepID=UPI0021F10CBE|nr:cell division protein FtsQ/DivIB [Roseomonas sp. SXEYE001]MCV4207440.1 cell division protein FtsQ/DivIB [Roseomonas sp. SXEYE001]